MVFARRGLPIWRVRQRSSGSVWVAAPERQCSGMSVRLTISETSEMAVYRYDFPAPVEAAWSVDGTPADCVKVALRALLPFTPDVVLSGINDGMNAGLDVAYSGTVGAATEAALHGIPAIAVSMRNDKSFEVTHQTIRPPFSKSFWTSRPRAASSGTSTSPPARFPIAAASCADRFPEKRVLLMKNYYHCVREENGVQYLSPKATVLRPDEVTDGSDIQAVLNGFVSIGKVRCAAF